MLFTLFLGFLLGSLTIIVVQVLGFLFILNRLDRKRKEGEEAASSKFSQLSRDLDPQESLDFAYNKQGVVWVLESEKVPKSRLVDKVPSEQKRKKEILEVSPVRKYAKIKDRSLILIESDGSHKTIRLKDCIIVAVSATALSSRKWAKRYPIKVESKTSVIYNGSKTVYIYLETSWDKESWCKALRHASCDDKERLNWFAKLSEEFRHYVTSLNAGYPSFMKPSVGFYAEPMDRENRLDGSSSKVRLFLKKLAKKASKTGVENKASWTLSSGREDRKICEKSRSFQDSVSVPGLVKTASKGKTPNGSVEENMVLPSSSTLAHSGSQSHVSVISDTDPDDKFGIDEGTLCWNLLISRLFFDAKSNAEVKSSMQSRIQRTLSNMRTPSYIGEVICTGIDLGSLPPYIHGMRVLPTDLNEVWALEIDIEYSGGAVLDIETRLEVRELDLQKGIVEKNIESSSMGEVTSDLLEGFEYYGEQLKLSGETVDAIEQKDERDPKHDGIKSCKSSSRTSTSVSRWKSILNSIAKQVSQVPLSLAIRVASLRGTLRLHIKPPPSDQLWFGFTSMPDIDFNLESSVGEHKITSGHIGLFLVSRFKTAIRETLLLPNYESVCIPWMLADKDDWVPQKVAPFIWVKQEAVNDPTTVREVPGCQPGDAKTKIEASSGTSNDHPEVKHEKPKNVERVQQPIIASSDTIASSLSFTNPSTQGSKSSQELRTPLLKNVEPQETFQCGTDENPECQSLSRSVSVTDDDDDARPKRVGRKERMLGLGKKMGEKLEEKRRHIEEKGRHIVEKMRGP